jgi:hypothetical protein
MQTTKAKIERLERHLPRLARDFDCERVVEIRGSPTETEIEAAAEAARAEALAEGFKKPRIVIIVLAQESEGVNDDTDTK